ncbi:sialate O-acetylesterase [Mucilaginibacter sp. PAMB04274]|uniref:sialate O-acetylesterase n=1 Tax=Mucilaginibacter sp. PAMB04274 TaxID=3138568 RepID=UPI0031F6302B
MITTYRYLLKLQLLLLLYLFSGCAENAEAKLSTAKLFADHMVLQRNQDVYIWGWSTPEANVAIAFNGQEATAQANSKGKWVISLKPMQAGGPYVMSILSGNNHISYKDVMIGEVWICSGQSNMQFFLNQSNNYDSERKSIGEYAVRQFLVPQKMGLNPEEDLSAGEWKNADSKSVGYFSAVGYIFAKQIAQKLHVAVGIINSSWGSSQAECWISKEAMLNDATLKPIVQKQPNNWEEIKQNIDKETKAYVYNNAKAALFNAAKLAANPPSFFDKWRTGSIGAWQWQDKLAAFRGTGFMQRTIMLNSGSAAKPSTLSLGETDADMEIFINGKSVFSGALPKNKPLQLPAGIWNPGANNLLLHLKSDQKDPWWFGFGINGDAKNTHIKFADTTLSLNDYLWKLMPDFGKSYHIEPTPNNTVNTVFNGMVNPLTPLSIAGVIWYQGEANAQRALQYCTVFPLLINDWRKHWKKDIPFVYVQMPSFGLMKKGDQESQWAELREAQRLALSLPNTGMAVTYDVGDPLNLHPVNKFPVGMRLASTALKLVYHIAGFYSSPVFKSAEVKGAQVIISFTNPEDKLVIKDGEPLKGFELAGQDHQFYPANAEISNNKVSVQCNEVKTPKFVRYAWGNSPIDANLFTNRNLPVSPFKADIVEGLTQ